jgi:DNA-binding protein HU-beta
VKRPFIPVEKGGVPVPMTKSEILNKLAEKTALKKKDVMGVLDAYNELIVAALKKDKKIKLAGLGIAQVKHRAARMARNPQTGEPIKVKAKTVVKFRISKELKDKVL